MYPIDERDAVVELTDVPKPSGGAPRPVVLADEDMVLLSYFVMDAVPSDANQKSATVATIQFDHPLMHVLGPPNDEALKGHPLRQRGLDSYSMYRVDGSSLLRRIAATNYVHPMNDPTFIDKFTHYIFTFHDSTFECVARSYTVNSELLPSEEERYGRMTELLKARDERWRSEFQNRPGKPTLMSRLRWWTDLLNPWPR